MMTLTYNGKPVPFGAVVTQTSGESDDTRSSIVGDGGEVYLVGLAGKGRLIVKWGRRRTSSAPLITHLPAQKQRPIFYSSTGFAIPYREQINVTLHYSPFRP